MPKPSDHQLSYRIQLGIVFLLLLGFVVLAMASPAAARIKLLLSAAVLFPASVILGVRWHGDRASGGEILPVFFGSFFALMLPLASAPPIPGIAGAGAFLGLLVSESLWAVHRYPIERAPDSGPLARRVVDGVKLGLLIAAGFSLLATVIIVVGLFVNPQNAALVLRLWLLVVAGYAAAGLTAGALIGAIRPLMAWPLGVMLTGILGGFLVYGAIAPSAALIKAMEGSSEPTAVWALVAAICALMAGPPAALGLKYSHV